MMEKGQMEMVAIIAIFCIFGLPMSIPLLNLWSKHQREMLELRLQLQQVNPNGQSDVEALRQEIRALRETSMQYDLSFDAALQRVEQRVAQIEQTSPFRPTMSAEDTTLTLRSRGEN